MVQCSCGIRFTTPEDWEKHHYAGVPPKKYKKDFNEYNLAHRQIQLYYIDSCICGGDIYATAQESEHYSETMTFEAVCPQCGSQVKFQKYVGK